MSQSRQGIREQWRRRIAHHYSSGQSVAAFCRDLGVSQNAFYGWKRRLRDDEATTEFVEVKTPPAAVGETPAAKIEVCLSGGLRLLVGRGFVWH